MLNIFPCAFLPLIISLLIFCIQLFFFLPLFSCKSTLKNYSGHNCVAKCMFYFQIFFKYWNELFQNIAVAVEWGGISNCASQCSDFLNYSNEFIFFLNNSILKSNLVILILV